MFVSMEKEGGSGSSRHSAVSGGINGKVAQDSSPSRMMKGDNRSPAGGKRGSAGKCLNFLHIPKTGGSSIELDFEDARHRMGAKTNQFAHGWGLYDDSLMCTHITKKSWRRLCNVQHNRCNIYHVPPSWDKALQSSYARCDTFCVVRHPAERLISQWRYETHKKHIKCSLKLFVSWLEKSLTRYTKEQTLHDCHFIPQARYVHSKTGIRTCQHVLRFENITAEFKSLMRSRQLPVQLKHKKYLYKPAISSSLR